jgi:lysophospholipase L1-like esterase
MATPSPVSAPASGSRWKKLAKRLAVLAAAMLLAGLLAEGLVLLILGEQVKFPRHVVAAPFGLRINQPNSTYRHKSPDIEVWFRINSQGMRADHDYPKAKPPGVQRILSLGDSFAIGYEVDVQDCFASVLERELRSRGYAVEVLNAGVSGYSTAEECLYLERELLQYEPDLVLVSFYTNDISDNLRTRLFKLEDDQLVADHESYVPLGRFGTFLNTNPVLSFLSSYSNAFALLKETFTREYKTELSADLRKEMGTEREERFQATQATPAPPAQPAHEPRTTPRVAEPPQTEPAAAQTRSPPPAETPPTEKPRERPEPLAVSPQVANEMKLYPKRLAGAILQRMLEDCRSRGIPLVVQLIPHLGEDARGRDQLLTLFPFTSFATNQPGLGFVDARGFLEPWIGKQQLYWLRSHRHWTPFSHELSGKALAEYIETRGLLKP